MKTKHFFAAMLAIFIVVSAFAQDPKHQTVPPGAKAPLTGYITTTDNENNALTGVSDGDMDQLTWNTDPWHPIEFNIFVTDAVVSSAQLSLYCYDVDWGPTSEQDEVFINGHSLGFLTGTNENWSTSVFNFNPAWVNNVSTNGGKNLIQIFVDQLNPGQSQWVTICDWGQLITNNSVGSAHFRYVNLDKSQYCGGQCPIVTEEVDADPSMNVKLETYLIDPSNNATAQVNTPVFLATNGDEPITITTLCLPQSPTPGTWKIRAICFDEANVQQDLKETSFTVTNPCVTSVPTLTQWGLIILGVALLGFGTLYILRWRGTSG